MGECKTLIHPADSLGTSARGLFPAALNFLNASGVAPGWLRRGITPLSTWCQSAQPIACLLLWRGRGAVEAASRSCTYLSGRLWLHTANFESKTGLGKYARQGRRGPPGHNLVWTLYSSFCGVSRSIQGLSRHRSGMTQPDLGPPACMFPRPADWVGPCPPDSPVSCPCRVVLWPPRRIAAAPWCVMTGRTS